MNKNEKIFIGYATSGTVYNGFMKTVVDIIGKRPDRIGGMVSVAGPYLATNRNEVVEAFLNSPFEWLFSIDTDIETTLENFDKLVEAADAELRPIVGGKYFIATDNDGSSAIRLCAIVEGETEGGDWLEEYPEDSLIKIQSTGMGFVLIHRKVFEAIAKNNPKTKYPWFYAGYLDEPGYLIGEDIFFYQQVKKTGLPIYMHTGATSSHLNKIAITEQTFIEANNLVWRE